VKPRPPARFRAGLRGRIQLLFKSFVGKALMSSGPSRGRTLNSRVRSRTKAKTSPENPGPAPPAAKARRCQAWLPHAREGDIRDDRRKRIGHGVLRVQSHSAARLLQSLRIGPRRADGERPPPIGLAGT